MRWRRECGVARIDIAATRHQPRNCGVSRLRRSDVQWRATVQIGHIELRTGIEELIEHGDVDIGDRQMQRRVAVAVLARQIDRKRTDQQSDIDTIALRLRRRVHNGCPKTRRIIIGRAHSVSSSDQGGQKGRILVSCSDVKQRGASIVNAEIGASGQQQGENGRLGIVQQSELGRAHR
jgi:hypothetical protein